MPKEHEKKPLPKSMNNPMLKSMKKKREKDSPYFEKATIKRERESHAQRSL
jgi:hypothetical protein